MSNEFSKWRNAPKVSPGEALAHSMNATQKNLINFLASYKEQQLKAEDVPVPNEDTGIKAMQLTDDDAWFR